MLKIYANSGPGNRSSQRRRNNGGNRIINGIRGAVNRVRDAFTGRTAGRTNR